MERRVALITGGARGIGRATALALAEKNWDIAVCYRTSADDAADLVAQVEAKGVRGIAFQCDVSDHDAAAEMVQALEEKWGRIDALINGAGPYHRVGILKESLEGWHSMFDNNLHPVFYLCRLVAPSMQKRKWGRIINFSMANAHKLQSNPMVTGHYIAKVGILVLTRTFAKVFAKHGITVNTISPGFIDSKSAPQEELDAMKSKIPAGYIGDVQDAVGTILHLLSDEARYVNGTNIQISGAWGL